MITIWIDADSCPTLVREYVLSYAEKNNFSVNFVANKNVSSDKKNYKMIICEKTKNSADDYIVSNAKKTDLVITRDVLLAERLVKKEIFTINDRGTFFSAENIKEKVEDRNYDFNLAQLGFSGSKTKSYGEKEFKKFVNCFEKIIKKILVNFYSS